MPDWIVYYINSKVEMCTNDDCGVDLNRKKGGRHVVLFRIIGRSIVVFVMSLYLVWIPGCASSPDKVSDADTMKKVEEYNQEAPKNQRIKCKNVAPTGSLLKRKVCKPVWKWEEEEKEAQKAAQRSQRWD